MEGLFKKVSLWLLRRARDQIIHDFYFKRIFEISDEKYFLEKLSYKLMQVKHSNWMNAKVELFKCRELGLVDEIGAKRRNLSIIRRCLSLGCYLTHDYPVDFIIFWWSLTVLKLIFKDLMIKINCLFPSSYFLFLDEFSTFDSRPSNHLVCWRTCGLIYEKINTFIWPLNSGIWEIGSRKKFSRTSAIAAKVRDS